MRREQRLRRLEQLAVDTERFYIRGLSDDELNRRIEARLQALIHLYDERGWPSGDATIRSILYLVVGAARRAAEKDPTPENLALLEQWKQRAAQAGLSEDGENMDQRMRLRDP